MSIVWGTTICSKCFVPCKPNLSCVSTRVGWGISLEIGSRAVLRDGNGVQLPSSGNLDLYRDRVTHRDIGRTSVELHGISANRSRETGRNIFGGQRQHIDRLRRPM